jgi:pimeloyl-ACP methyl ester carboxylesterase
MIAERFRVLRPDARAITVDGAGHNVHRDRPDIVNPEVLSFLGSARDGTSDHPPDYTRK